jgi:hypothetical protein
MREWHMQPPSTFGSDALGLPKQGRYRRISPDIEAMASSLVIRVPISTWAYDALAIHEGIPNNSKALILAHADRFSFSIPSGGGKWAL